MRLASAMCMVCACAPSALAQPFHYFANFSVGVGGEWSTDKVSLTPIGSRAFLGEFINESAVLTLHDVPTGELRLKFELFVIRTWDGDGALYPGPDTFAVDAVGLGTLLNASFANQEPNCPVLQSYPDPAGMGTNPPMTGSSGVMTLGYTWQGAPVDSEYDIDIKFVNPSPTLVISFTGSGLQAIDDESWGIAQVEVGHACSADCDGDGSLDFFDYLCFQNAFATMSSFGDRNHDGVFDAGDFDIFNAQFAAGCGGT